jgi:hypothetical protein
MLFFVEYMIVTAFFHTIFRRFYRSVNLSFLPLFRLNYTFIILGCLSPDNIIAQEIPWPIDSPKRISSSFGEPRPGRFHFGVDFKSGGVTGKKVYAIGDGYISHVQTSPFGYGKGLYLTLDSGKTAVYGHLSGFLPEIEDRLFRMRISKKTYDVKLWFKPDEFKVRQGQVIAYSGDTGSGAPHLHLELRDEKNIPLNLLDYGLVVHDDIPPVLDSVMLIPFDKTSSIDGSSAARLHDLSSNRIEPFVLSGRIGVGASVYDNVNLSNNHLAIYQISLAVDSTVVFSKSYNRLPYSVSKYGSFDYLSGEMYGIRNSLSSLFRRPGIELDFYEGDGALLSDSMTQNKLHTLTVRAQDYSNNTVERSFPVIFGLRPVLTACSFTCPGKLHIAAYYSFGLLDHVEIRKLETGGKWLLERTIQVEDYRCDLSVDLDSDDQAIYKVLLTGKNGMRSMPAIVRNNNHTAGDNEPTAIDISTVLRHDRIVMRIESTDMLASLPLIEVQRDDGSETDIICPVPDGETAWVSSLDFPHPGKSSIRITASALTQSLAPVSDTVTLEFTACDLVSPATIFTPDSLFSLTVPPEALYRPAPVIVDTASIKASNGLIPVSPGYYVFRGDEPQKGPAKIALEVDRDPSEKAALYSSGNGTKWSFLSPEHEGRVFTGMFGGSGYAAVFVDKHAPYVSPKSPRPGGTATSRRPLILVRVEDKGSGIEGSDSFDMNIDGIPIYGEYDYEGHKITYKLQNALKPGLHTVKITVTDRAGNAKTRKWNFTVPRN